MVNTSAGKSHAAKASFGLAVSTMRGSIVRNTRLMKQINGLACPVVVVNQGHGLRLPDGCFLSHVEVIESESTGLSISRNMALSRLNCDYVVLCDDDIELDVAGIHECASLFADPAEGIHYRTQLRKSSGELWRDNYPIGIETIRGTGIRAKRLIQRCNSMELVLNRHHLLVNGLQFDERFGLGSHRFSGGEEVVLLHQILLAGGALCFLPTVMRVHPPLSSGQMISCKNLRTIFTVHWVVFKWLSPLVSSFFLLKVLVRQSKKAVRFKR